MKRTQIAPYKKNGAMQLIVATGTGFIIFHFTRVVMLILGVTGIDAMSRTASNTALPEVLYQQIVASGKAIPNIVYIDYVNAITTKCIIQYNFLNKKTK